MFAPINPNGLFDKYDQVIGPHRQDKIPVSVAPELIVNAWSTATAALTPGVMASVAPLFTVSARSLYESEVKLILPQPVTTVPPQ